MRNIVVPCLVLLVGCSESTDSDVPTALVVERDFEVVVETIGTLDAAQSTIVSSTIGGERGKIIWLIDEGSRVSVGDALVRLDPTPFQQAIERLTSEVAEQEAIEQAYKQALGWEEIQTQRQQTSAMFDLRVAELDLLKLEKGDGPLELSRLESAVQTAQRDYDQFTVYFEDLKQLMDEGIISEGEVQQGARKVRETEKVLNSALQQYETYRDYVFPSLLEKAKSRVERMKLELEQTKKSSQFQLGKARATMLQAEHQVEAAKDALVVASNELSETTITAPIPGMVVYREEYRNGERRKPRVGDTVLQNQPLLYLPDITSMIVETFVREVDVHKVQIGTPTSTRVDAFPEIAYEGEVLSIGVLAENQARRNDSSKVFQVSIQLTNSSDNLRPGMTARSVINSGGVENALCIPVSAVFVDGGTTFCYRKDGSDFEKSFVELGSQNDNWVEVLSGLSEGDYVSLIAP
jgi:HlyD family secretion protein